MKQICILLFALAVLASCSDSSSSDDGGRFGEVSFNISRDISGQKSGMADFHSMSSYGVST